MLSRTILFASWGLNIVIRTGQELGGWESEEMARRYAHLSKPQLLEHAELVSNVFIGTNLAHTKKKEARENL